MGNMTKKQRIIITTVTTIIVGFIIGMLIGVTTMTKEDQESLGSKSQQADGSFVMTSSGESGGGYTEPVPIVPTKPVVNDTPTDEEESASTEETVVETPAPTPLTPAQEAQKRLEDARRNAKLSQPTTPAPTVEVTN